MKNYSEQIKMKGVGSTDFTAATATTVLGGNTDVKIKGSKVVDTSGDTTGAFDGLSAGDVIYMTGWDNVENNGVFEVVNVEDSGSKLTLDYPLLDESSPSTGGATMYSDPSTETVSGVEKGTCVVTGVTDLTTMGNVYDANLFRVTDEDEVSHFAATGGNDILIIWADLTKG